MTQLTGFRTDREGSYIVKDPQAELDFSLDWSSWMDSGDSIATSTWTVQAISGDGANALDNYQDSINTTDHITTVWLRKGVSGNNYRVTNTMVTANGLKDERYFRVFIKDRTA
jgi:hypothetical protein